MSSFFPLWCISFMVYCQGLGKYQSSEIQCGRCDSNKEKDKLVWVASLHKDILFHLVVISGCNAISVSSLTILPPLAMMPDWGLQAPNLAMTVRAELVLGSDMFHTLMPYRHTLKISVPHPTLAQVPSWDVPCSVPHQHQSIALVGEPGSTADTPTLLSVREQVWQVSALHGSLLS